MHTIYKSLEWLFISLGVLIVLAALSSLAYDKYNQPQMVANILKINTPPTSLIVLDCASPITTDVITTCVIEISPHEFKQLLSGYKFEKNIYNKSSHSVGSSKVGPEFQVTTQYTVWPKEFKNGGAVSLFTNSTKNLAIVELYIE